MSAFLDENGKLVTVSESNPLPVDGTTQQLPSSLGIKTSANSVSVTPASDAVTVVAGYAADGQAPINPSVLIGAKTPAGLKKTITTDSNGCIYTRRMIVDTTGAFWFDPDSCSYTLNKTSDGTINTEVYVDSLAGKTYTKTYTTTSTQITATGWVAS